MSKECLQCATDNADSAAVCINCGATLIVKEAVNKEYISSSLQMTDLKSCKVIKITGNCTIGRSGNIETEFFAEDMYISEYHCKIVLENGEFKIEHLPTAKNPTKINDVALSKGISRIIRDGDYLTIADKMFQISICTDDVCENTEQEIKLPDTIVSDDTTVPGDTTVSVDNIASTDKIIYTITCPVCGLEYEVSDINARINECSRCDDDHDKREISGVRAKVKYAN
jgi:hypothetical protein